MQDELSQVLGARTTILREVLLGRRVAQIQLYGSNIDMGQLGHDIDLLVVLDETCNYDRRMIGPFDLIFLSCTDAYRLARVFDPVLTEPVLTGKTIAGSPVIDKRMLECSDVSELACRFLFRRAEEVLNWTISSAGETQEARNLLRSPVALNIIQNLGYIASYIAFSIHYSTQPKALTLEQLCRIYPASLIAKLRRFANGIEFGTDEIECVLEMLEGGLSVSPLLSYTWVLDCALNPKLRR